MAKLFYSSERIAWSIWIDCLLEIVDWGTDFEEFVPITNISLNFSFSVLSKSWLKNSGSKELFYDIKDCLYLNKYPICWPPNFDKFDLSDSEWPISGAISEIHSEYMTLASIRRYCWSFHSWNLSNALLKASWSLKCT